MFFIVFESAIYVFMGGLAPAEQYLGTSFYFQLQLLLIFQLFLGGLLIMFLDEVTSKWGFGSGISLFIAAGVSKSIFIRAFNWLPGPGGVEGATYSSGAVPAFFQSLIAGDVTTAMIMLSAIFFTVLVFAIAVYAQSMKVEIPLSFGMVRGHGIRWPLSFVYTSNIPVILVAALIANFQLWGRLLQNTGHAWLGTFSIIIQPVSGLVYWLQAPQSLQISSSSTLFLSGQQHTFRLSYMSYSSFWERNVQPLLVQTAGMDAKSQARQMISSGLQIPDLEKMKEFLKDY